MRWTFLPLVVVALSLAVYGSNRGSATSLASGAEAPNEVAQLGVPPESGEEPGRQPITLSLSLYVVHEASSGASSDDQPTTDSQPSDLSSKRTEGELLALADRMQDIWRSAGIVFDPVIVHTVEIPAGVALSLQELDSQPFFQTAGQVFDVPEIGNINGFYLGNLGPVNGFAPATSNVFFVTDEPSVHDERVSSHEIGHILGLGHAPDDPDRLMYSGTNGMSLTEAEIETARATARAIGGTERSDPGAEPAGGASGSRTVRINNHGGAMEGHTPRGFAGSGTGLFVGDNLNPNFPDDDGVQVFLTFDIPAGLATPSEVSLTSDALQVEGTPFADLGPLLVEPVTYDDFGPDLFDLAADGPSVECQRPSEHTISCDVTNPVADSIADGKSSVQFRLYFDRVADLDQSQDLAKFFRTDSNTNEPGLFTLVVQP